MPEKMVRYNVQVVAPERAYEVPDLIAELSTLVEGDSEIKIVSVEIDSEPVFESCQLVSPIRGSSPSC
jgi:hypothetical protein